MKKIVRNEKESLAAAGLFVLNMIFVMDMMAVIVRKSIEWRKSLTCDKK
jgi:hypothetical protein